MADRSATVFPLLPKAHVSASSSSPPQQREAWLRAARRIEVPTLVVSTSDEEVVGKCGPQQISISLHAKLLAGKEGNFLNHVCFAEVLMLETRGDFNGAVSNGVIFAVLDVGADSVQVKVNSHRIISKGRDPTSPAPSDKLPAQVRHQHVPEVELPSVTLARRGEGRSDTCPYFPELQMVECRVMSPDIFGPRSMCQHSSGRA